MIPAATAEWCSIPFGICVMVSIAPGLLLDTVRRHYKPSTMTTLNRDRKTTETLGSVRYHPGVLGLGDHSSLTGGLLTEPCQPRIRVDEFHETLDTVS